MKKPNFSHITLNHQKELSICWIINNEFNEAMSGKRKKPSPTVITDIIWNSYTLYFGKIKPLVELGGGRELLQYVKKKSFKFQDLKKSKRRP